MEFSNSTEALTRFLRSKTTSTSQIIEIASRFDEIDLYFPNKEIFILELIQDRWNDQKLVNFKQDYRIWKLYNDMFTKITDNTIKKKLLKDLRFVPHLMKTLEVIDSHNLEFLLELERICVLINSMIRVEVSAENAITIVGKTLYLIHMTDCACENLILEIINLTDLPNFVQISKKISECYCRELFLPTVKYFVKFNFELTSLAHFLSKFLFESPEDPVRLVEGFVKTNHRQLKPQDCVLIFEKSMHFLSKKNFVKLENIFTIITSIQKKLAPSLLKELSVSKKTMSQEFLDRLLLETLNEPEYDLSFWSLILHILDLDVEIGIQHFDILIKLVIDRKNNDIHSAKELWGKLIHCFTSAREFLTFLEKIQIYCGMQTDISLFLLEDSDFANNISNNISTLSIAQLKFTITNLIDKILKGSSNTEYVASMVLKLTLRGLSKLSYISLTELKSTVSKVFEVNADHSSKLWEIWYLAMEIYDDIVPLDSLESIQKQLSVFFSAQVKPKELFYYFFKLREYTSFDISPLSYSFLQFLQDSTLETRRIVILNVFTNWYTLINSFFPKKVLEELTNYLVSGECIDLLNSIFQDDNIFEESNLIYSIVQKLFGNFEQEEAVIQLTKVPIQCINKTIRADLINNLSSKNVITKSDIKLLGHLLTNPTFKSNIEKRADAIYSMLSHTIHDLEYDNLAIEKIWQNHLGQVKEGHSIEFIENEIDFITKGMNRNSGDMVCFQMAFFALKVCRSNILNPLKNEFISKCLEKLTKANEYEVSLVVWILRALYYVFKMDRNCIPHDKFIKRSILDIRLSIKSDDIESQTDLLTSLFLLYSITYDDKLEYLYAHYLVLRDSGIKSEMIIPAVEDSINICSKNNLMEFNKVFANIIFSLGSCDVNFSEGLLELYRIQVAQLEKENLMGTHLFAKSISEIYTNCKNFKNIRISALCFLETLQSLLVSKPWLFSQYCIEMLFPLCLKLMLNFMDDSKTNDDVFIATTKVISNILLAHSVKLSSRHHLVNGFLCVYLELIADYKNTKLTSKSAKSLSRLISNFVEPSGSGNNSSSKKNTLSSTIGIQKKLLRKYAPVLLIKYIHLSIYCPFEGISRKELMNAIYAIFDLLSQAELNMINGVVDQAGRQYFKSLYTEYRRVGKWDAS